MELASWAVATPPPPSLRRQDISSHAIDYIEYVGWSVLLLLEEV